MTGDNDDILSIFSVSDTSTASGNTELGEQVEKPEFTGSSGLNINPNTNLAGLDFHSEVSLGQRHQRFFVPEEFLTLRVDSVYFKVPTFVLKANSKKLREILETSGKTSVELCSLVRDITAVDLERFLAVLFPTNYHRWDAVAVDEWESILKVAYQWEFQSIYGLALGQIEPHATPVDLVVLGGRYNIPGWVEAGRLQLCRREDPITLEEALRMGMEEAIRISAARHHIRAPDVLSEIPDARILSLVHEEQHNVTTTQPPEGERLGHSGEQGTPPLSFEEEDRSSLSTPMLYPSFMPQVPLSTLDNIISGCSIRPASSVASEPSIILSECRPPAQDSYRLPSQVEGQGPAGIRMRPPNLASVPPASTTSVEFRITRALDLRKRLYASNIELDRWDEEMKEKLEEIDDIYQASNQILEDNAAIREQLEDLFSGLERSDFIPVEVDLQAVSWKRAAQVVEAALERLLYPGVMVETLTVIFSNKKGLVQRKKVLPMLRRRGFEYTNDPLRGSRIAVTIPP